MPRRLDKMLRSVSIISKKKGRSEGKNTPEISPQVNNLPHAQSNQHAHSAKGKPLDTLVGRLIGITQLLLAVAQVFHLIDNLGNHFFDSSQVGFNGLELLLRLDAGPVARVGADFNVEFNFAAWAISGA